MQANITLGKYLAQLIHNITMLFYQNLFSIDGFTYLEDNQDIEVIYRVTGKRRPFFKKKISQLIKDEKRLNCFSRQDVCEMGIFYGRLMEQKIQNRRIRNSGEI